MHAALNTAAPARNMTEKSPTVESYQRFDCLLNITFAEELYWLEMIDLSISQKPGIARVSHSYGWFKWNFIAKHKV